MREAKRLPLPCSQIALRRPGGVSLCQASISPLPGRAKPSAMSTRTRVFYRPRRARDHNRLSIVTNSDSPKKLLPYEPGCMIHVTRRCCTVERGGAPGPRASESGSWADRRGLRAWSRCPLGSGRLSATLTSSDSEFGPGPALAEGPLQCQGNQAFVTSFVLIVRQNATVGDFANWLSCRFGTCTLAACNGGFCTGPVGI